MILIFIPLLTFISFIPITKYYFHYYTLYAPSIVLGGACCIYNYNNQLINKPTRIINLIIALFIITAFTYYSMYKITGIYRTLPFDYKKFSNFPDFKIPESDKNNAIGYNVDSRWYLEQNIIPSYKYFTFQEWFAKTNPQILIDFNNRITLKPPKWLIVRSDSYTSNATLNALLKEKYEIKAFSAERAKVKKINYDNLGYTIYKLK